MASRRTFLKAGLKAGLKTGLGACAAGALILPCPARTHAATYYKAVFDERFADACAFAEAAAKRGIPTAAIRGDTTNLFYNDLDLRWKQGPVLLAGYTTEASLFCLDLLARDRGMRVVHRRASSDLVFWTIAPAVIGSPSDV